MFVSKLLRYALISVDREVDWIKGIENAKKNLG